MYHDPTIMKACATILGPHRFQELQNDPCVDDAEIVRRTVIKAFRLGISEELDSTQELRDYLRDNKEALNICD